MRGSRSPNQTIQDLVRVAPVATSMKQPEPEARLRTFAAVRPGRAQPQVSVFQTPLGNQKVQPLPPPTGKPPYRLKLADVLPKAAVSAIQKAGRIVFHAVGDTGGVKTPAIQQIVADHMADDFTSANPNDHPAFFYHLGDVVYYDGEAKEYSPQFYEPYLHYPAPIFAIPGNHDGEVPDASAISLSAFMRNFCAPAPEISPDAGEASRQAMTQPNCYWTLDAPFLTFVGLYTNVPEGGWLDSAQTAWLASEFKAASPAKALLVALHHPPYSVDTFHSGSAQMGAALDQAIQESGRVPDVVLSGHVHNYQRFSRNTKDRAVPYIVAGAGGYWHLHSLQKNGGQPITPPFPIPNSDVTLEASCADRHGYLRVEVSRSELRGEYWVVPRPHQSWTQPSEKTDSFIIPLHR